jgi:hypothetical protein
MSDAGNDDEDDGSSEVAAITEESPAVDKTTEKHSDTGGPVGPDDTGGPAGPDEGLGGEKAADEDGGRSSARDSEAGVQSKKSVMSGQASPFYPTGYLPPPPRPFSSASRQPCGRTCSCTRPCLTP